MPTFVNVAYAIRKFRVGGFKDSAGSYRLEKILNRVNTFLANVPILYPLKISENL